MRVSTFILIVMLTACAGQKVYIVDQELEPYVERFEKYGNISISNLVAKLGDIPDDGKDPNSYIVGLCANGEHPTITIHSTYFANSSDAEREELIFHELGHCILNRDHDSTTLSDGCPNSIMNPYTLSEYCFTLHHAWYITELFKNARNK